MGNTFPHRLYLSAAIAFAAGGMAMTAGILAGDPSEMRRLMDAYLHGFHVTVIAVIGTAVWAQLRGD